MLILALTLMSTMHLGSSLHFCGLPKPLRSVSYVIFFTQLRPIISGWCDLIFAALQCSINDIMLAFHIFKPMASNDCFHFSLYITWAASPLYSPSYCSHRQEKLIRAVSPTLVCVHTNIYFGLKLREPNA